MADPAISIRVAPAIKAHLEQQAKRAGDSFSDYVRGILEEHVRADVNASEAEPAAAAELLADLQQLAGDLQQHRADFDEHRGHFRKAVATILVAAGTDEFEISDEEASAWVRKKLGKG